MNICAVIPSSNRGSIIGDAIKSVLPWVDHVLLLHLLDGIPEDNTVEVAREIAGKKLLVVDMTVGPDTTMDKIRNRGLEAAGLTGSNWGVEVDTDVRIILNGVDIRTTLAAIPTRVQSLQVTSDDGTYDKFLFHRLPASSHYEEGVHEELVAGGDIQLLPYVRFHELPKTSEQLRRRMETGDLPGLYRQIEKNPGKHRWRFLLAETLATLGREKESVPHYLEAMKLATPEEKAWDCFRLACALHAMGRHSEALRMSALGMADSPDSCELPWMAGIQCLKLGQFEQAVYWARIACLGSWLCAPERKTFKAGYRRPEAYFDGPYQVMADAYEQMGKRELESFSRKQFDWASKERAIFAHGGSDGLRSSFHTQGIDYKREAPRD